MHDAPALRKSPGWSRHAPMGRVGRASPSALRRARRGPDAPGARRPDTRAGWPGFSLLLNDSGLGGSDGFGRGSIVRLDGLTEGQQTEDGSDKQCVFHDSPQVDVFIVCPLAGKGYE